MHVCAGTDGGEGAQGPLGPRADGQGCATEGGWGVQKACTPGGRESRDLPWRFPVESGEPSDGWGLGLSLRANPPVHQQASAQERGHPHRGVEGNREAKWRGEGRGAKGALTWPAGPAPRGVRLGNLHQELPGA